MTIRWKAVEQYFTVKLFVFQFYPLCNFVKFINFGVGIVTSERVEQVILKLDCRIFPLSVDVREIHEFSPSLITEQV